MNQQTLLDYLKTNCRGREQAKTGEELKKLFGCKDVREVQQAIESLRGKLYPILSFNKGKYKGYCWVVTAEEAAECLQHLENRAKNSFRTWWNVKRAVEETFKNQLELEFKKSA